MTDGAWSYTRNQSLAQLRARNEIRHLVILPYRPLTNGKIERFHQTMARRRGYGMTDRARARALPCW